MVASLMLALKSPPSATRVVLLEAKPSSPRAKNPSPSIADMGRLISSRRSNVVNCLYHLLKIFFIFRIVDTVQLFGIFNQPFTLFLNSVNVTAGTKEERMMLTGLHTVSDIFCVGCGSNLGWNYISAHEKNQKYKEGKFVLERYC
ncbi:hypothetical protein ZIOFF_029983 [Zingiber officinale]|uniref:Protein yippee-like n=1 Tax=Zingiber officinale TaxID=94328 RepID=A0A8J5LBA4_ZINOF|nr:hypothetical protein ZIOFF_029983 [Zingiber officinale]